MKSIYRLKVKMGIGLVAGAILMTLSVLVNSVPAAIMAALSLVSDCSIEREEVKPCPKNPRTA